VNERKLRVDNDVLDLSMRAHRLLLFLAHPTRVNQVHGMRQILKYVNDIEWNGGRALSARPTSVMYLVDDLRAMIEVPELCSPITGFIRPSSTGYAIVDSLKFPPFIDKLGPGENFWNA
jgi:hypothetical protein